MEAIPHDVVRFIHFHQSVAHLLADLHLFPVKCVFGEHAMDYSVQLESNDTRSMNISYQMHATKYIAKTNTDHIKPQNKSLYPFKICLTMQLHCELHMNDRNRNTKQTCFDIFIFSKRACPVIKPSVYGFDWFGAARCLLGNDQSDLQIVVLIEADRVKQGGCTPELTTANTLAADTHRNTIDGPGDRKISNVIYKPVSDYVHLYGYFEFTHVNQLRFN